MLPIVCRRWRQGLLALLVLGAPVRALAEVPDGESLAQRFRPYYKFSCGRGGVPEPCRPCSWQWFAAHSDLYRGTNRLATAKELEADPQLLLRVPDGNIVSTRNPTGPLKLRPGAPAAEGEPWQTVTNAGAGLYAQVEDAGDHLVVLTYWTLFGCNRSTAMAEAAGGKHEGDLTAVTLVYDRLQDKLVRASFGLHGRILESFDLVPAETTREQALVGCNEAGTAERVAVRALRMARAHMYQDGPFYFSPAPAELYLAQDPRTQRFEHLAVFCEWGAHEPWPNPRGSVALAPDHNGQGLSFLPGKVRFLGSFRRPVPAEAPFVYFNGYWGSVPKGPVFHRSCFYPEGRKENHFRIPERSFVDRDFYESGPLRWPPTRPAGLADAGPLNPLAALLTTHLSRF